VCLVAVIDSLGYYLGLLCLCNTLGVALTRETKAYLEGRDQCRAYHKEYQKCPCFKRKHVANRNETIREGLKQQKEDGSSSFGYGPSLAVAEQIRATAEQTNQTTGKKVRQRVAKKTSQTSTQKVQRCRHTSCKWCQSTTHFLKACRQCPENEINKQRSTEGALNDYVSDLLLLLHFLFLFIFESAMLLLLVYIFSCLWQASCDAD